MVALIACVFVTDAERAERVDADGDGHPGPEVSGDDCDDTDAAIGAPTEVYADEDGDGFGAGEAVLACEGVAGGDDCDDSDADVNPAATEIACDEAGVDEDCDGAARCALEDLSPSVQGAGVGMSMARLDDDDGIPQIAVSGHDRVGIVAITGDGEYALDDAGTWAAGEKATRFGETLVAWDFDEDGVRDLAVGAPGWTNQVEGYGIENGWIDLFHAPFPRGQLTRESFIFGIHDEGRIGAVMAAGTIEDAAIDPMLLVGIPAFDQGCGGIELIRTPFYCDEGACNADEETAWRRYGASFKNGCYVENSADALGSAIAVADVFETGHDDLVIGAPGADRNRPDAGMVYFWFDGAYEEVDLDDEAAATRILGENDGDAAGGSVAFADLTADGTPDIVAGAAGSDLEALEGGAVYVWDGLTAGAWDAGDAYLSDGVVTIVHATEGARFGTDVAAAGDLDGDGRTDLAVSAPGVGEVWLIHAAGSGVRALDAGDEVFACADAGCDAGAALLGAGDLTGDAVDDLLIGMPGVERVVVLEGDGPSP